MHLLFVLLAAASISCAVRAQNLGDYYVNGRTGQDLPGYGGSAIMPWKTITYALSQIPPIDPQTQSSNWRTLYIEGDQDYSAATNGETLPIVPRYNVWMEGTFVGHGRQPRITPPPGGTGMAFDPGTRYERNPLTIRYLVFVGGRYGMTMGGSQNQRHRPRIQECTFMGQSSACVLVQDASNSRGIDPRFVHSRFANAPRAIEITATRDRAVIYPDVEECWFEGLTETAIHLEDTSANGSNVGGQFRSCIFARCNRGVRVRSSRGATTTNFLVFSSLFRDVSQQGVWMDIANPRDPAATIERCTFVRCGTGVLYAGALLPGPYTMTLANNVARACATGYRVDLVGAGQVSLVWSDNLALDCDRGYAVRCRTTAIDFLMRSSRDRALRNRIGLELTDTWGSASSLVRLDSAILSGSGSVGLDLRNTSMAVEAHSLTLADNGIGLQSSSGRHVFDHCVFGGNVTDLIGSPSITYSCLQGSSVSGAGNLNLTDPQLVRPVYKLAPTSPCIDAGNVASPLAATDYEGDPRASVSRMNGPALPDIGADEYVQLGSVRPYGVRGFGLFNFFPRITSPQTGVVIGGSLNVRLEDAIYPFYRIPAESAFLLMGLRDDSGMLPFDLTNQGAPGSLLWTDVVTWLGPVAVTPAGTASVPVPIPREQLLVGRTFCFQWMALKRGTNDAELATSDGLRVTIGA